MNKTLKFYMLLVAILALPFVVKCVAPFLLPLVVTPTLLMGYQIVMLSALLAITTDIWLDYNIIESLKNDYLFSRAINFRKLYKNNKHVGVFDNTSTIKEHSYGDRYVMFYYNKNEPHLSYVGIGVFQTPTMVLDYGVDSHEIIFLQRFSDNHSYSENMDMKLMWNSQFINCHSGSSFIRRKYLEFIGI